MKKSFIQLIVLMFFSFNCIAQNEAIEKNLIAKKYDMGEIDLYKYQNYSKVWLDMKTEVGYPIMPFNHDSTDIFFGYVTQFDSLNKKIIYNRIMEWLSLKYSNLDDYIDYQDSSMGKIVFKNNVYVSPLKYRPKNGPNSVNYTSINRFTVNGNKLRIEIFQISLSYNYSGNSSPEYYSSPYSQNYPIISFFPICKTESDYWKLRAYVLQWTKKDIENMVESINAFVADYKNDYNF